MAETFDLKNYFRLNTNVSEKFVPNKSLIKFIQDYYNKNVTFFSSNGLNDCPTFGNEYRNTLLGCLGLDEQDYLGYIKNSKNIDHNLKVSTNSTFVGLILSASADKKNTAFYMEFLAFIIYSSKFVKYFKFGTKKVVMDELFNHHLDNNSFIYKYRNISKVLQVTVDTLLKSVGDDIYRCSDRDILLILNSLSTRINLLIRKIAEKYYELDKTNSVTFVEKSIMSEDQFISVNTNSNKLQSLMYKFKDEELKYGVKIKIYKIVDANNIFYENITRLYKEDIGSVFNIFSTMLNIFITKRDDSLVSITNHFANDVYTNKIKSKELTELHDKVAVKLLIPTNKREEFRKTLERYIALRVREISRDVK